MVSIADDAGGRVEIIQMSPVIHKYVKLNIGYFILHAGQHYLYNLDRVFFEHLNLSQPKDILDVRPSSQAGQTGKMFIRMERTLTRERPNIVLVWSDPDTVLATTKLHINVGCVGVGDRLYTYDINISTEINGVLADHCSDCLFSSIEKSKIVLFN